MKLPDAGPDRRLFITWIVMVVICVTALAADAFIEANAVVLLGIDLSDGLSGASLASGAGILVTSVQILRVRKGRQHITVRELRSRASRYRG